MKTNKALGLLVAVAGAGGIAYLAWQLNKPQPLTAVERELGMPDPVQEAEAQARREENRRWQQQLDAAAAKDTFEERYETPSEAEFITQLVDRNRARHVGDGVLLTSNSTDSDRRFLAEIECRRAIDDYGMPLSELPACVEHVSGPRRTYRYTKPGARRVVDVRI